MKHKAGNLGVDLLLIDTGRYLGKASNFNSLFRVHVFTSLTPSTTALLAWSRLDFDGSTEVVAGS